MLKSVPSKLGGAFFMVASMLILLIMPWADKVGFVMEPKFKPGFVFIFVLFVIVMLLLGWLGGKPVSDNILPVAQLCTGLYFLYFIVVIPLYSFAEFVIARYTAKRFLLYALASAAFLDSLEPTILKAKWRNWSY
jgi:quinol-cytochrome oxidoreductase complex cytochrome b subunit